MPRIVRVLLIAGLAAFVVACGNKGPLVLPDQQPPVKHKKGAAPADSKTPAKTPQEPARTDQNGADGGGADTQH